MSKSILVIDTPDYCIDCPCHFAGMSGQVWCGKENKELLADDIQTFKPDWCPLRELSNKSDGFHGNMDYNNFIHKLLEGGEA